MNKQGTDTINPMPVSSLARVRRGLAARHRSNRRFRACARLSYLCAAALLIWLLASLVGSGVKGFIRHELVIQVDTRAIEEALRQSPDTIAYHTLLHESLLQSTQSMTLTDATPKHERIEIPRTSVAARPIYQLAGTFAAFDLKRQLLANPAQWGKMIKVRIPLSDNADQYYKGAFAQSNNPQAAPFSAQQQHWLKMWQEHGSIVPAFNRVLLTAGDSRAPESAGLGGSMVGSILLVLVTMLCALPIGVMSAIYLEEYAKPGLLSDLIEVTINNLAAVPSIIFGLLGLTLYLLVLGLPRSSALVGGLTIALMILPIIIITTRASLKAIPASVRHGAIALGASPVQVVMHHVLPYGLPGIMTGTILGIARALGETAPLLMIGMVAFVADIPRGIYDPATVLPVQIYVWASSPELGFIEKTASAILVLLTLLLLLNIAAHHIRSKYEIRW